MLRLYNYRAGNDISDAMKAAASTLYSRNGKLVYLKYLIVI